MPSESTLPRAFPAGEAQVAIYPSSAASAEAAAAKAAQIIQAAISQDGRARVVAATGNSQIAFIQALLGQSIDWSAVELFHMDEYAGIDSNHPASFQRWIRTRIADHVHPFRTHFLQGDSSDIHAELRRYQQLLNAAPIHVAFVGFGENGHIAFNDPPTANFQDPATVKLVLLDDACRRQQAGEGHFADISQVPKEALTITCSGLFRARAWVCHVPDLRKAEAVRNALEGSVNESCPASLVRNHPNSFVFLDSDSASLLTGQTLERPRH